MAGIQPQPSEREVQLDRSRAKSSKSSRLDYIAVALHSCCGRVDLRRVQCRTKSFTNHFRSKKSFCLEVLDRYFDLVRQNIEKPDAANGSRRPRSHRHCCDKAQLLLRRPAGCLNRQAVEDRGNVSPERRAVCSLRQVAILDSSHEPLPEHGYN
jgi:hypothetical protein